MYQWPRWLCSKQPLQPATLSSGNMTSIPLPPWGGRRPRHRRFTPKRKRSVFFFRLSISLTSWSPLRNVYRSQISPSVDGIGLAARRNFSLNLPIDVQLDPVVYSYMRQTHLRPQIGHERLTFPWGCFPRAQPHAGSSVSENTPQIHCRELGAPPWMRPCCTASR